MGKVINIQPISRIEGHARGAIQLDDAGNVADAKFHVVALRGFEKFCEGRPVEEMPRISSVYHNRLREGWLLQADPTVLYALGGPRQRLLFAAIDSVADNPYNTYRNPGLPPGPIGAPGAAAIDAALEPATENYLYFVAWPDGSHVFSRTLTEHNRAIAASRRERDRLRAQAERPARGAQR